MKIQIKKDYFINELKKVTTVVGNNPINPILSNILLVAEQNELDIYGSNDLISIKSVIKDNIKIEKTGKCLISAKTFSGIVEKINEDEFEIEMIDATLRIKSDTYSCDLNTFNDADFYEVDFNESENKNILNFEFIKNINSKLLKIIPANKLLDNSPFRGILIDAERLEGFVEFIATDSFHLGYIKEPNNGQKYKFILNTELIKLLYSNNKDNSNYELFLKDNRVLVKNGNTYFNCSLVEGEFPNVAKILESPNQFFAKIKKNHLINAIEKAQILNESEANSII
jgi:DNA polymerase-3 subunit beta